MKQIFNLSPRELREALEAELSKATLDRFRIAGISQALLAVESADGKFAIPIGRCVRAGLRRITDLILSDSATAFNIRRAVATVNDTLANEFGEQLNRISVDQRERTIAGLKRDLTTPQLRAATRLPITKGGRVRPQPGKVGIIRDPGLSLSQILLFASPLLSIRGDVSQELDSPAVDSLFDTLDTSEVVERADLEISNQYRIKINKINKQIDAASNINSALESSGEKAAVDVANRIFKGGTGNVGIESRIQTEARHEALRIAKVYREETIARLQGDSLAGYVLHSRFLDATDPVHAANDGKRFYKDNRPESADDWIFRIIPPYRKNCVCWTQWIFEDPNGDEFYSEFSATSKTLSGARRIQPQDVGGKIWDIKAGRMRLITQNDVRKIIKSRHDYSMIEPRDVKTYALWFNQQLPGIKRRLMGASRYDAVIQRGVARGQTRYSDFVDVRGRILSPKSILDEGIARREIRVISVDSVLQTRARLHREAWNAGGNKWRLLPNHEERNRRLLRTFLNRVERN